MYEHMTFEVILQRMLDRVSDNMDKREGSIIYDALAPSAVELQLMYIEFDTILKETFGDTASREYLIRRAKERGLKPYGATKAVLKGEFTPSTLDIAIGTRFSLNELNYKVIEKMADGIYKLECETYGVDGNKYFDNLIPVDYIDGLESAKLTELLIPADDEEETEHFRDRYFASFDVQSFGGNRSDYVTKTNAIAGVGATKVTPTWNGGGTVKLTILDSIHSKANKVLIDTVQEQIDPTKDGSGLGIAPIGHIVTVDTVTEVPVHVVTSITYDTGYSFESLQSQIVNAVEKYLLELRQEWQNQDGLIVRIAQIETRILQIVGVLDITNTTLNGTENNVMLGEFEIPVLGGVTG